MRNNPSYSLSDYVADLRRIAAATSDCGSIFAQVGPLARTLALAKDAWLKPEHRQTDAQQGFGAHLLHEEPDHSLAIFALAWAPHNGTPPHDHGTWAIVAGVEGIERNVKFNRLDDRARPGHAELRERCAFMAGPGDLICLKPRGIHLVWNDNDRVTISLHTYGRHFNHTDRSSFDLKTNQTKPFIVSVAGR